MVSDPDGKCLKWGVAVFRKYRSLLIVRSDGEDFEFDPGCVKLTKVKAQKKFKPAPTQFGWRDGRTE